MDDLNGRLDKENKGKERWVEKYGEVTKNTNGTKIIDFHMENNLVTANTKTSTLTRNEKSIVDYFLVIKNLWHIAKATKVRRGAEILKLKTKL